LKKNKRKKILVVGGTGFIGYYLLKDSIKKNRLAVSFSKNFPKKHRKLHNVKYITGDIYNKSSLKKIKGYFDYVVNLGGYVDHTNKKKVYRSHYLGCINLVNFFKKKPPQSFIQMGSSGEYGRSKSPQKETIICHPLSIYNRAKFLASKFLLKSYKQKNFPITILRLYQAYGPRQDINRFIPIVIDACLKNKKFPCSNGNQFRDFVHVKDVVQAINKSLINKKAKGEIINIGSGKPQKIKNLINNIKSRAKGGYPQFGKLKLRKEEILKIYPDINKAKKILGWKPIIDFKKGLTETIKYYKKIND
jgi:nucleoside-diphosphate-sugar epimerase